MIRNMVKNIFLLTFLCAIFFNVDSAFASVDTSKMKETSNENILFDPDTEEYYDLRENGYIDEVYKVEGGKMVEKIPVEEYINYNLSSSTENTYLNDEINNNLPQENTLIPRVTAGDLHIYFENSNSHEVLFGKRASIIQKNYGPGDDSFSLSYNHTQTAQWNVSLNSAEIKGIAGSVGYSYSSTLSVSSTSTMVIPAKYFGYWRFDPIVRRTTGTLYSYLNGVQTDKKSINATYPVAKYAGVLDGFAVAVKLPIN